LVEFEKLEKVKDFLLEHVDESEFDDYFYEDNTLATADIKANLDTLYDKVATGEFVPEKFTYEIEDAHLSWESDEEEEEEAEVKQ
jgi:hypothetical protein